ncbi:MAG: hypothetical protein ACUVXJ_17840 [Phycisphaerae bacterium]
MPRPPRRPLRPGSRDTDHASVRTKQDVALTDGPAVTSRKDAYDFYRLHIPDPVWFHKDIRVTIQVMGGPSYRGMLDALNRDPSLKLMKAGKGDQ